MGHLSPLIIVSTKLLDNVSPHSGNRYFLCLDLEEFFPSISYGRVKDLLLVLGYSAEAATVLTRLCTCKYSLPQGGVTSPSLSNLIAATLDRRIGGYTSKRHIVYTRYADDITLFSNRTEVLHNALPTILNIIKSEKFKPNMKKLRFMGPRRKCLITGLVKNSSEPNFGIGKKKKRHMRAVIFNTYIKLIEDKEYKNRESIDG